MDDEEALDPRIQIELEKLNTYTDEINRLEKQFDKANATFQSTFAAYSQKLNVLSSKIGKKCLDKARPYFIAREAEKRAQLETQRAAFHYQRAVADHQAAKQKISEAEQRFLHKQEDFEFDSALQEMLNKDTIKVVETEAKKAQRDKEHQKKAVQFAEATNKVQILRRQLKGPIEKSKTYFDLKEVYQKELENLKMHMAQLQETIVQAKRGYSNALSNLEVISEEIHAQRCALQPREPGVGAEKESLPDVMLDKMDSMTQNLKLQRSFSDESVYDSSEYKQSQDPRDQDTTSEKAMRTSTSFLDSCASGASTSRR